MGTIDITLIGILKDVKATNLGSEITMQHVKRMLGQYVLLVACLTMSMPGMADIQYDLLDVRDFGGGYNFLYDNGTKFYYDALSGEGYQVSGYPGKKFQFFIADFDRYTTEISIMEADSPISVNATYDAIDWALGRNATKIVSIENMEISGFRAAFVESQWEDGYLYVAVVPVGQTAKITVAKIGDRKSAMYVINKMKIWK
ncbi:MAG: hypothetical protein PHQ24_09015 [Proteiniphilum sp.]|jgi:hypothetical protein|nr:hypothetical protein [Proteiniphilum sp.]